MEVLRAGANAPGYMSSFAIMNCRTPAGHPEGYLKLLEISIKTLHIP